MCVDCMCVDCMCVDCMCVDCMCVDCMCVDCMCVDCMCVDCMCVQRPAGHIISKRTFPLILYNLDVCACIDNIGIKIIG